MIKKISLHTTVLLAILALLSGVSCTRQEQAGSGVTLTLSSGLPETRGATELLDGSEIYLDGQNPDLVLLMFNAAGDLIAKYPDAGHSEVISTPAPTGNDLRIRITADTGGHILTPGTYSIYAVANKGGLWTLSKNGTDIVSIDNITTMTDADAFFFNAPPVLNGRMPLTAIGTVDVNASGNGAAELSLLRPVGKVTVKFVNRYGASLTLAPKDASTPFIKIKDINPNRGYLFPHESESPAGVVKGVLSETISSEVVLPDNTGSENAVYEISSLVYPGTGDFKCDIAFKISKFGDTSITPQTFSFTGLPMLNKRGEDITTIDRNQWLTVTVSINKGKMLSFSFEVGTWNNSTETVTFD